MGHASVDNICNFFINQLHETNNLSILDCVKSMIEKGEKVHASEGSYDDEGMLRQALSECIHFLSCDNPKKHGYSGPGREGGGPWIVPTLLTKKQRKVYQQWDDDECDDWGDSEHELYNEYEIFDSIQWKFAPGWKKKYKDIPILEHVTH